MASCVWQSISLTFLWTTFFVRIFLHDCMTLRQSGLTVFPVDSCPRNLSEVEAATLRLNCSDVKGFRNVYHCLPVSNLSLLVEFCYNRTSGLTGEGNCLVLSNEYINVHQCNHFTTGCPSVPYYYKDMFNFPDCTQINKQNSCYEADPSCPNISFVEATTRPAVNAMENNTVLVGATTRLTVTAVENNSVLVEPTTIPAVYSKQNITVTIPIVLGLLLPPVSFALIILCTQGRQRSHIEGKKDESSCPNDNIEDNKVNRLASVFKKKGFSIRFNKLRLDLIKEIPDRELNSLKASLKVTTGLCKENVKTVEDFFTFLFDEGIFQERNVVMMQYLLRSINRLDLERRCVRYAKESKQNLCYFEETTLPGDGYQHIQLHIVDDMEQFTDMDALLATVAAIVGCDESCIKVVGVHPQSSFIITISMKEEFARTLTQKGSHGLVRLLKYNVDWIKVENEIRYIAEGSNLDSRGYGMELGFIERMDNQSMKEEGIEENLRDMSLSHYLSPTVVSTSSITVPELDSVYHISFVTSDKLWVSDNKRLQQVDSSGHEIVKKRMEPDIRSDTGFHTVTEDGELLFINRDNEVQKITSDGTITTLIKPAERLICCIHSSRINGDILLGCLYGVMRYDRKGQLIGEAMEEWISWIYYPRYITENKNGDIWVSDKEKVVVVDKSGRHRFDYTGQQSQSYIDYGFEPRGICTDILGQVLLCDFSNSSVHLLNQDGQFLCLLLTREHGVRRPKALCVDDKHSLYLGQEGSNTIRVYKYSQETGG